MKRNISYQKVLSEINDFDYKEDPIVNEIDKTFGYSVRGYPENHKRAISNKILFHYSR